MCRTFGSSGTDATPAQVYEVTLVFRDGLGYDSAWLREAARGKVGIY